MSYSLIDFFCDPLLRAPTVGSMLMSIAASLMGVIVFVRRNSLVAETLSHAAYPGLIAGVFLMSWLGEISLVGALGSSLLGLWLLRILKTSRVKSDAAFCVILSSFFGIGVLFASYMQAVEPVAYRQAQTFLYGQVATMVDTHIWVYAITTLVLISALYSLYRLLQMVYFDPLFARGAGVPLRVFEAIFSVFLAAIVVISMRSVGVVLISGMLVAPALGVRQWTGKLSSLFVGAAVVGAICGFLGNYSSVWLSYNTHFVFPTGPLIVIYAALFAIGSLCMKKRRVL